MTAPKEGRMRTTLDLDEGLMQEAMRVGRLRTKTELIHRALEAFIQRKRLEGLLALGGKGRLKLIPHELRRTRRGE